MVWNFSAPNKASIAPTATLHNKLKWETKARALRFVPIGYVQKFNLQLFMVGELEIGFIRPFMSFLSVNFSFSTMVVPVWFSLIYGLTLNVSFFFLFLPIFDWEFGF